MKKIISAILTLAMLPGIVPVQAQELYSQTFDMSEVKADGENGVVFSQEVPDGDYTVTVTTGGDTETNANIYINGGERVRAYTLEAGAVQENEQPVVPKDGKIEVQVIGENPNVTEIEIVQLPKRSEKREKPYIYIAGDSTAQTYDHAKVYPQTGWGQVFGEYFTDDVVIENRSMGGRSLKRFDNDGRLDDILTEMYPGDYVFIQFGINDGAVNKPERYISVPDYKEMLKTKYIGEIEKRGGIPVLLTATPAAWWDEENGCFMESRQDYAVPTREVAEETGAVLLDVNKEVTDSWNELIKEYNNKKENILGMYFVCEQLESKAYPTGTNDTTHLKENGAKFFAAAISYMAAEAMPELKPYVKGTLIAFDDMENHWAESAVTVLRNAGVVNGVDGSNFMPDKEVTRAEYLQMLMKACGIVGHAYREGECLDVTNDDWFCYIVQSALDKGLIPEAMLGPDTKKELVTKVLAEATEDKEAVTTEIYSYRINYEFDTGVYDRGRIYVPRFDGNKPITREEMAALTMGFVSYWIKNYDEDEQIAFTTSDEEMNFTDADEISSEYLNAIDAAYNYQIINGMGDGTFAPKETLTRAQAASAVHKMMAMFAFAPYIAKMNGDV